MNGESNNPIYLLEGERIDDLQVNGLQIIQNPSVFRFGCDAVELANFVAGGCRDYAVDLGSGSGIIAILLAGKKGINVVIGDEYEMNHYAQLEKKLGLCVYPKEIYNGNKRLKHGNSY